MLDKAVREKLATLLAEASEVGRGLPRYVERDFARYLECGVLAHGFARVRCQRPWVAGNTLCQTREFWRRNPFLDLNIGEDACFPWSAPSRRLLALKDPDFFVALIHSANVESKRVHQSWWHTLPPDSLRPLMGEAFDTYQRLLL